MNAFHHQVCISQHYVDMEGLVNQELYVVSFLLLRSMKSSGENQCGMPSSGLFKQSFCVVERRKKDKILYFIKICMIPNDVLMRECYIIST